MAGHDQIVVNFVRNQHQIVAFAEIGHAFQFFPRPDPTARIVGRAEDEHFLSPCHLGIPSLKIHHILARHGFQRAFHHMAARRFDDPGEGVIDGRGQDHAVTSLGERIDT